MKLHFPRVVKIAMIWITRHLLIQNSDTVGNVTNFTRNNIVTYIIVGFGCKYELLTGMKNFPNWWFPKATLSLLADRNL